ncbi:MAG: preprotein translocase subunit YajC [Clostridia bacterium]|nr:preprotein translocase subunit YajC [Clostridia bacterium]
MGSLLLMGGVYLIIIVGFYFILIRPQKKRQKKEEELRNNVQVGDEIVTVAGVYGRVVAIKEDSLIIESGPDRSKQRIARWAIQQNLTIHED